ncbi:MAG: hypothetical protein CL983_06850 [Euryarchaeota archaeon]|nr:hypothetical protein [Euryarchaeota archaeon]
MNNEDDSDVSPLKSHKTRWNQKDLLGRIVSRHFNMYESLGGIWPSWVIEPLDERDVSDSLEELNLHLKKLDWMAKIYSEKPYVIKILPIPKGLFILGKKQLFVFWTLAFLSVLGMGIEWIGNQQKDSSILDLDIIFRSLLYYSIPLIGTLFMANMVQKFIAKRNNIRIGNMIPILFPIPLPIWPFGIIAIPNHPRMDSICWPNTKKMIAVCISGPAIMIISGAFLLTLGILLSPESINGLNSMPLKVNPPLIIELMFSITSSQYSESLGLYWLHPIGFAGIALTLIGWINLLPLPTLAGGRILAGLMGLEDMAKASTQIALMALIVIFGISYGFLEGNSLWTFVVIGGFTLLFMHGTDQRLPIILDETKKINDSTLKNFASLFVILLLLLLPAKIPLEPINDWDSDIEIRLNSTYFFDENNEIVFSITNPSLNDKDIGIKFWFDTPEDIILEMSCIQENIIEEKCENISLEPHSSLELKFKSKNNIKPNQNLELILLIENLGIKEYHQITFIPNIDIFSTLPRWESNENLISPELCTTINNTVNEVEISTSHFWKIDLIEEILYPGENQICISGNAGFLLSESNIHNSPTINYSINGTNHSLKLLPPLNFKSLFIPPGGLNFTNQVLNFTPFEFGNELEISNERNLLCSNNTAHPLMSSSEMIFWNATSTTSRKILPNEINKTLLIELPKKAFMIECDRNNPFGSEFYSIKEGPLIYVNGTKSEIAWGSTPLWNISKCDNCSFNNPKGYINFTTFSPIEDFYVSTRFHGDIVPWDIYLGENELTSKTLITSNNETEFSISWDSELSDDIFLMAWLDFNSDTLEIHLTAWSGVM